jgi:hypothetical protein
MKATILSKRQAVISVIIGLTLWDGAVWPALAQENAGKPAPAATATADPWKRQLARVWFEGIPLGEVVKFLREKFPEINFVVVGEAGGHAVFCELHSVGLADILKVFELAANGSLRVTRENERLISFTINDPPRPSVPTPDPPMCRVFNLGRYLEGKSPEELDRAIQAIEEVVRMSLEMMADLGDAQGLSRVQMPEMSIHRDTKLLIVVGRAGPSMEAVEQVVQALQEPYGGFIPRAVGLHPGVPSAPYMPVRPVQPAPPPGALPTQPTKPSPDSTKAP